ncbi:MAG: anhydro-N-acetylmuramic acid kinase [Gemmatimonadaceae bacterium]|nr:anhydro-N-acetylmuramic acid kinase [Chitinophagaceae bacterium]
MIYKAIGIMSGSSLDGLDIAYVHFQETGGKWNYELINAACLPYSPEWIQKLKAATGLSAYDYQVLHSEYGHYIGEQVNRFIDDFDLHHKVDLVSSHGHTTFHDPSRRMTGQIGNGASIAAETCLAVVSDLRALDVAFGGQGAPIVPIGEKLLLGNHQFFLNLGGIANISYHARGKYIAYDICPANRVLNMIIAAEGKAFDEGGQLAATGNVNESLLRNLETPDYYKQPYPKSLANDFGTDIIFPMVDAAGLSVPDTLRTFVEHIVQQIAIAVEDGLSMPDAEANANGYSIFITGGGAHNSFMVERLAALLKPMNVSVVVPDADLINYKEAIIMALMGVLRWREEYNVIPSVTGASRDSINGALWLGTEA